jgi:hypothetical protein
MVSNRADWTIADREALRVVTGDGLLVIKGDYWKFQRELVSETPRFDTITQRGCGFADIVDQSYVSFSTPGADAVNVSKVCGSHTRPFV